MTRKILYSILGVAISVLGVGFLVVTAIFYNYFGNVQKEQLQDELALVAVATEKNGVDYLEALDAAHYRISWISADGSVLYDTNAEASEMENHLDREEVQEALKDGKGSSSRFSATLMENTVYEATRLSDGTILRISVSYRTAFSLVIGMIQPILILLIAAVVASAIIAKRVAGHIMEPLEKLDLEHPLDNDAYEELAPLLSRIHHQKKQIADQLQDLQQRKDEFEQITGNMKEGLVLLDSQNCVLSINPAAIELFQTSEQCIGQDFLTIDRKHDMIAAIELAIRDGHSEIKTERNGREYQFDISRIESAEQNVGAVLLAFDITEQSNAERMRREFSANVTHELKTPLQTIMGSAELIENGLVKPEDMPRFVGRIQKEAARLITLIENIIQLSQLDEGSEMPREDVSLYMLAEETLGALQSKAASKNITLKLDGMSGDVYGVRSLFFEVIYNLCDNAIKYNVEGGSVHVSITENKDGVGCTVSDTGIGIPAEHQARVFERFYRVDKSHSKKSGGTGLGLSIVKHAVQDNGGTIAMESEPGKGTTMRVIFPKR